MAPGVHIWSCRAANVPAADYEDVTPDGFYGELSGTSMAAPHVAGTVALMLRANPNLTPAQVKAILRQTARLNNNLNGLTVNDRGYGIIDALAAVQLAPNPSNIQIGQMYDSFSVSTPGRDLGWWCCDYLTYTMDAPSASFGSSVINVQYHYRHPLGYGNTDYEMIWRLGVQHVWIDGTYYNLGSSMNSYLQSGPRIYDRGGGYANVRAFYQVGGVRIEFRWYLQVDTMYLWLIYSGGSSWKTLIITDTDVWGASSNCAYLPSTSETVLVERKISGNVLTDIRDPNHGEYVQVSPWGADNPIVWILKYGYFGNNPDDYTISNSEYVYKRDIVIYYQGTSSIPGGWIYRKTDSLPAPNPQQNDLGTGGDAGNSFDSCTTVGSYASGNGILCSSDPTDTEDWYQFSVESGQRISVSMIPPYGINFDVELYDPARNKKAESHYGSGVTDGFTYTAASNGYWRLRVNLVSGEGQYYLSISVYWPGGGGCPILYTWNGSEYVCEGLLDIHDPTGADIITEHYLTATPKRVGRAYLFELVEHPQTESFIDQVRLFAIVENGRTVELPLIWAWHSEYGNVLQQLLFSDNQKTQTTGANRNNGISQSINLRFAALASNMKINGFLFQIEGNNPFYKV